MLAFIARCSVAPIISTLAINPPVQNWQWLKGAASVKVLYLRGSTVQWFKMYCPYWECRVSEHLVYWLHRPSAWNVTCSVVACDNRCTSHVGMIVTGKSLRAAQGEPCVLLRTRCHKLETNLIVVKNTHSIARPSSQPWSYEPIMLLRLSPFVQPGRQGNQHSRQETVARIYH